MIFSNSSSTFEKNISIDYSLEAFFGGKPLGLAFFLLRLSPFLFLSPYLKAFCVCRSRKSCNLSLPPFPFLSRYAPFPFSFPLRTKIEQFRLLSASPVFGGGGERKGAGTKKVFLFYYTTCAVPRSKSPFAQSFERISQ